MRLTIDREADALYLQLGESDIVESEQVSDGVVLDYSKDESVVGIEIWGLSKRVPSIDYSSLHYEMLSSDAEPRPSQPAA